MWKGHIIMSNQRSLIRKGSRLDRYLERHYSSEMFTYNKLFGMLIPIVLDNLFIVVISILTTAMISASSQESVSAVSMINPVTTIMWAIISSISVGGTVIVAQYMGSGNQEKIKEASGQVLLATTLVAVISSALLIVFAGSLVDMVFGAADPIVKGKAQDYLVGLSISQVFLAIYCGAFGILRGVGATKLCLKLTIMVNLIHLLLSVLFLNVMKLDIVGTSLSLIVARFIGAVVAILLLMYPKSILRLYPRHILHWNKPIIKSILYLGIPYAMEQIFANASSILVQTYMVQLGTMSIAANAIANSSFGIIYTLGGSVGILATTIVGQSYGAGNKELTRRYGMKMVRLATVCTVVSIVVVYPFLPYIYRLYLAPTETITLIKQLFWILVIPMPFLWAPSNILPSVLRATGDMAFTSIVSLITLWAIRVGLGYFFAIVLGFGLPGAWICGAIEWAVRGLIFYLRYRSDAWLMRKTIE